MTQEYDGPPGLQERVIAIICKEWPNEDNELQMATIYEQLVSEGVGNPDAALSDVLLQLADHRNIQLAILANLAGTSRCPLRREGARCGSPR